MQRSPLSWHIGQRPKTSPNPLICHTRSSGISPPTLPLALLPEPQRPPSEMPSSPPLSWLPHSQSRGVLPWHKLVHTHSHPTAQKTSPLATTSPSSPQPPPLPFTHKLHPAYGPSPRPPHATSFIPPTLCFPCLRNIQSLHTHAHAFIFTHTSHPTYGPEPKDLPISHRLRSALRFGMTCFSESLLEQHSWACRQLSLWLGGLSCLLFFSFFKETFFGLAQPYGELCDQIQGCLWMQWPTT